MKSESIREEKHLISVFVLIFKKKKDRDFDFQVPFISSLKRMRNPDISSP